MTSITRQTALSETGRWGAFVMAVASAGWSLPAGVRESSPKLAEDFGGAAISFAKVVPGPIPSPALAGANHLRQSPDVGA